MGGGGGGGVQAKILPDLDYRVRTSICSFADSVPFPAAGEACKAIA